MKGVLTCFLLFTLPFLLHAQNILQQEWVKPEAGTLLHRRLNSLGQSQSKFLMSGIMAITDSVYGCVPCDSSNPKAWLLLSDSNGNKCYSHCLGGSASDIFQSARFGDNGVKIWAEQIMTTFTICRPLMILP